MIISLGATTTVAPQGLTDGQVLEACRSLYLKGFVPWTYGDRTLFGVTLINPATIDNAGQAGIGMVLGQLAGLKATPEQRQRAIAVITAYDREYRNLLREMLWAAITPRPRSQLGAMRQVMLVLSKVSFGILAVEGWTSLNTALNTMARRHGFPFNDIAALNHLKLSNAEAQHGLPAGTLLRLFYAWEDGRPVSWESPEAEWYFANNEDVWMRTDGTGQISGGDSQCSETFPRRIDGCAWFGWDTCNIGKSLEDKITGFSSGNGTWWEKIIASFGFSHGACQGHLKLEILLKRNIWCYENGITPPSMPELGNLAIIRVIRLPGEDDPAKPPDPCIADPSGPNCFQSPANSWLGLAIAGGTAGFYTAGPQGAAIGAAIGAVIGAAKK